MLGNIYFPPKPSLQFLPSMEPSPFSLPKVKHNNSKMTTKLHLSGRQSPSIKETITATATANASAETTSSASTYTLYQVLGVEESASQTEIKAAYRHLAKLYHPDVASSQAQDGHFVQIHHAYTTLSNPAARARYDFSIGVAAAGGRYNNCKYAAPTKRWETDQCW